MKRAQLHQATITALLAVVDDEKSYGLRKVQTTVLMDTEAEWDAAIIQIREALAKLDDKLNPPPCPAGGTEGGPSADST